MADTGLQDRIIKLLNSKPKKTETLAKIVQTLRVPKKSLNIQLYKLKREGRIAKAQESPPVWTLQLGGQVVPGGRQTRSRGRIGNLNKGQQEEAQLEESILDFLRNKKKPSKSLEIAKAVGKSKSADVNVILYNLNDRGVITKVTHKPPTWRISLGIEASSPSHSAVALTTEPNFDTTVTSSFPVNADGTPIFQDTVLFKTELSFDSDINSSDVSTVNDRADSEDEDADDDDGFGDDNDDEEEGDLQRNDFERESPMASEDVVGGSENCVKDDNDECSMESDEDDQSPVVTMDISDNIKYGAPGSSILIGKDTENFGKLEGERNDFADMDTENERGKGQQDHDVPEPDRDRVEKPKSFRDMFRLDEPLSDDTSNSVDSAKDFDSDINSTPEIKVKNETSQLYDTPDLINQILDLQDEELSLSERVIDKSFDLNAVKREVNTDVNDGGNNMDNEMRDIEEAPVDKCIARNESSKMENEIDAAKIDGNSAENDMSDCDKVLTVLQELKGIAQFVLKRKTDIPPENLDAVLQKCLELKYISGSTRLWKITDEGMEYISQKTGKVDTMEDDEAASLIHPENKVKPTFKGPPLPPMALLGKSKSGMDGNKANGNSRQQSCSSLHSTGSLIGSSASSSLFSSSAQKNVPLTKGNSGLKPLMSLNVDASSLNKSKINLPPNSGSTGTVQPLMSIRFDSNSFDKSNQQSDQTHLDQSSDNMSLRQSKFHTSSQFNADNQTLWGSGVGQYSLNSSNKTAVTQDSGVSISSGQLFKVPVASTAQRNTVRSQETVSMDQRTQSLQNDRQILTQSEKPRTEIPSKYADYPNQTTSMQNLKSKTQSKSKSQTGDVSKSVFSKGPPPSPMDIISNNMKKTDISPPSSYKNQITVSLPSNSFSTMSQTTRNIFSDKSDSERNLVFHFGQSAQTGSQSFSSGERMIVGKSVNQTNTTQSASLFGNQSAQLRSQSVFSGNQSVSSSSGERARSGGPPPPPAVKLGRQTGQFAPAQIVAQPVQTPKPNLALSLSNENFNALNKNPVSALMEYAQSRKLVARVEVISRRGSSHKPTFEMAAFVGDRKFPSVTCHNKKDGRKEACDIALRQLVAEGQFKAEASNSSSIGAVPSANMTHFDTIAALTHRGFTALVSHITAESFAGRKVIAGLVMKRSADDTGVLISLGTGNRCITGQQLSLQGNTVNDSHAEIITRRGFLRFLYKQLLDFDPSRPHPMFETSPNGKLRIRPNISFHLYISTAPCGDGALFSPRDAESQKATVDTRVRPPHEPIFSSNVQGILRTKVEGGEGTIPIEPGFKVQTFDGIQRGERLRTMSCTDKVCRWNVVGMQGALLSHFLEPIYLDSLTLGLLYDHGHLSRAVCCRVGRGESDVNAELPSGYKLNHPWLGRVTVCDPPREVQKTKALSINWCFGDKAPEVTDGTQGICCTSVEKDFFSRCSKHNLFNSFKALCEKFGRQDLLQVKSYNEAKVAAEDFVMAKEVMLKRFKDNGFGKWVSKPVEEEMFGFDK